MASKFFPADDENGEGQYPLCETDYFRRLGLLCYQCGGALRGSYITALDRKYHVDHFTCSMCDTIFGAQDSYYEHDGNVYCHYHYSTRFAQRCNGCQTAILKQFVEIFRNGQNQHWHPECYMIHKFWNVRLGQASDDAQPSLDVADPADRQLIRVMKSAWKTRCTAYGVYCRRLRNRLQLASQICFYMSVMAHMSMVFSLPGVSSFMSRFSSVQQID